MTATAVDTNVLVASNRRDTHADLECTAASVEFLLRVKESGSLLLDQRGEILGEYSVYCSHSGQPGLGDEFFRWAFQEQGRLPTVPLHEHPIRVFVEFPDAEGLAGFDRADRKFVAAAIAHGDAVIANAVDSDYSEFADELSAVGVEVLELCPHQLRTRK